MRLLRKYYLYLSLFSFALIVFTASIYIFINHNSNQGFVDWKLTPVYRGSGLNKLIYNITVQNTGNTTANNVKMFIYQENENNNFTKGEFTGAGSYIFKPLEPATFEYGVPLRNVKSMNDLLMVRKTARLEVLWDEGNITKNKIFILDPNPTQ